MFVKKRIDLKINRLVANSNFIRTIMMENDIFDEIIGFLSEEGEISRYADIDGDLLEKFNSCKSPGAAALSKSKPMIRESDVPSDPAGKKVRYRHICGILVEVPRRQEKGARRSCRTGYRMQELQAASRPQEHSFRERKPGCQTHVHRRRPWSR